MRISRERLLSSSALLSSNVLANAILFLGVFIISKLVTPADLGIASAFLAISLAVYPIFTMRYELAIPVVRSDRTARTLLLLCVILSVAMAVLVSVSAFVAGQCCLPPGRVDSGVIKLLPLMGPAALILAVTAALQMIAIRAGALRHLALFRTLRAVLVVVFQCGLVLLVARSGATLVLGEVLANLGGALILLAVAIRFLPRREDVNVRAALVRARAAARRYKLFAFVSLPHAVIHQSLVALYGVLVGTFYGVTEMGLYFLMRRVIFGTIGLLSVTVYQVCLAEASKAKGDPARIRQLWLYAVALIGVVAAPGAMILIAFGERIFGLVFGAEWAGAGLLSGAAFALIVLEPITSALAFIPVFMKRQPQAFLWSLAQNAAAIVALAAIFFSGGTVFHAILGSSIASALVMGAFINWTRTLPKDSYSLVETAA